MRIAHILRKYYPAEWGGTETAVQRLLNGLRAHQAEVVVYCPKRRETFEHDPLVEAGHQVHRFRAFLPVWGLTEEQKKQLLAVGGNLMSFDLLWKLQWEPDLAVMHTHTLNRLGGIAATVARVRRMPLVVTIHGGVLDLPAAVRQQLVEPLRGGLEWGKVFGWLLRSRCVLDQADAILTCNRREAALLKERYPDKIIIAQPHGVPASQYQQDHRPEAEQAFPHLADRQVLLAVGRLDPVKNQEWLLPQLPRALDRHPNLHLVLAGACTDEAYGKLIKKQIRNFGLEDRVTLTGGLRPADPSLIGLFQKAAVVALPSLSETFGLVILEAWAAGAAVIATRTSGVLDLVRENENGWLFDLRDPGSFHACLDDALLSPERTRQLGEAGRRRVQTDYDCTVLAGRVKHLYDELIGES
jgi:alpha-maltose-1-phosphate synthase